MSRKIPIVWITHPRHLPKAPGGRVAVVDVAFAAGSQYEKKTLPFLEDLGERLIAYVDHHEHPAWAQYKGDPRYTLVPNKRAHACPELVVPELVEAREAHGAATNICAHADFDGLVSAVKWRTKGVSPWPEADEDARAVDSPGRGHSLSEKGERYALAVEEASIWSDRKKRKRFLTAVADVITEGEETDLGLTEEIDTLATAARIAAGRADELAAEHGSEEAEGIFVVRLPSPVENRMRKRLLMYAEERAPIGALYEPDPNGGAWVTAATFDQSLDLELVEGFEGGRSDFRFARALKDGKENIARLASYLSSARSTSR